MKTKEGPMAQRSKRLPATDRKDAIIAAATPVFARLGRTGATTKIIAQAAGVSEALLYKHFPAKDALYAELERHCVDANAVGTRLLEGAQPSTATLVMGVSVLVQAVFPGIGDAESHDNTKRLVTSSLLSDGQFAKTFLARNVEPWIDLFAQCLTAARAAGDVTDGTHAGKAELWFVHHLANTLHLVALSGGGVIDYSMSRQEVTASAVLFLLRGLGLKEAAIDRHYDPGKLDRFIAQTLKD
jgi:AcrR family transcriptional regulator